MKGEINPSTVSPSTLEYAAAEKSPRKASKGFFALAISLLQIIWAPLWYEIIGPSFAGRPKYPSRDFELLLPMVAPSIVGLLAGISCLCRIIIHKRSLGSYVVPVLAILISTLILAQYSHLWIEEEIVNAAIPWSTD